MLPKADLQDVAEGLSGGTLTPDNDLELNEYDAELLRRFLQVVDGRKHKAFDGILSSHPPALANRAHDIRCSIASVGSENSIRASSVATIRP